MSDVTPERERGPHRVYANDKIEVTWEPRLCIHVRNCVRLNSVFDPDARPWVNVDGAEPEEIASAVVTCPTGALHYRLLAADAPEEPTAPTTITRDPAGPLLVRGDLVLDTPEGPLRETRAALCACGRSQHRPFCDGGCGVNAGASGGTRDQAETSQER